MRARGASPRTTGHGWALSRPNAWYVEGAARKAIARGAHRCVECGRSLASARSPYCGRTCQWRFRGRFFWDAARTYVLFRDRYRCQVCGRRCRAHELDVDHRREIADGGATLDYANLQSICRPCHRMKTSAYLKGRALARRAAPSPAGESPGYWLEWFPS